MSKKEIKTASITLEMIKDHGWRCVAEDLGFDEEKSNKVFEYGEYANGIKLIIDENLNIIGGYITPFEGI